MNRIHLNIPSDLVFERVVRASAAELGTTMGFSDERIHVFLARDLSKVPEEENGFVREHEEAHLVAEWVPLAEAAQWVLQGRLLNGATVIGILAAYIASADDFSSLRELIAG